MITEKKYADLNWLYQKYCIEKLSSIAIAKLCGCSSNNIRRWLKIHNIKIRSESESLRIFYARNPNSNPMQGRHHSVKTRKKMSDAKKGKYTGEKNHRWTGEIKEKTCLYCLATFKPDAPCRNEKTKFCSYDCWHDYQKKHGLFRGKNHPRWKGGKERYFNRTAREVWEKHWNKKIPIGFHIHHKDGNNRNNEISNLVSLSASDHVAIHNRRNPKRRKNYQKNVNFGEIWPLQKKAKNINA